MENIFVEFLPPWIETGIQPAFYDKESGTVLQQTARMYARVNMLIRMFNKLSKETKKTVEEYIDKFNELHDYVMDYFANLDVQEEINNKLDAMAEAGTLADIIADYIQLKGVLAYDSVADLKNATNIVNGSFVETYGFYAKGDGGGAKYKIRNITNDDTVDEILLIEITADPLNQLVAELMIDDEMNIKQFGAKAYDENDPVDIKTNIEKALSSDISCLMFDDSEYLVSLLNVERPIVIKGYGTTLLIRYSTPINQSGIFNIYQTSSVEIDGIHFKPLVHSFTQDGRCVNITESSNVTVKNCWFDNMNGDGIIATKSPDNEEDCVHHIYIYDNQFTGTGDGRNSITVFVGNNIFVHDNYFENPTKADMPGCFDIEPYFISDYLFLHDIYFENNVSKGCKGRMVDGGTATNITMPIYNVVVSGNICDCTSYNSGFFSFSYGSPATGDIHNFVIKGNTVNCDVNTNRAITLNGMKNVDIIDNVFNNGWITLGGALSSNVTDTNIKIIGNTFTRTTSSNLIGTQFINIRLATDQVVDVIDNKFIYEANQYVQPLMFLPASDQPTPTRIAVWSNTFLRPTTTTASSICSNYTADLKGNVSDSYLT